MDIFIDTYNVSNKYYEFSGWINNVLELTSEGKISGFGV